MTREQFNKKFAKWVKARRAELNLTQEELAQKTGLTQIWVSHFEAGRRVPDAFGFQKIQSVLGIFY